MERAREAGGRLIYRDEDIDPDRCKTEFGGNRWLAVWTDYLRSRNFDLEVEAEAMKRAIQEPQLEDNEEDPNPLGLLNG